MKRPVLLGVFIILTSISFAAADTFEVPSDFPTIQQAINAASDYDIIVVDDDVYTGVNNVNLDFEKKKITLRSRNGAEGCVINGGLAARAFIFQNGEDSETVVEGFTIVAGLADYGGAIECQGSSPTIKNCMFVDNVAYNEGGAIDCFNSSPLIENCVFNTNIAGGFGGAIECYQSSPTVKNCLFIGAYAAVNGGAIDCSSSSKPVINNCTISDNSNGSGVAGGISSGGSSQPVITNCILWNNTGDLYGCSATFSCIEDGDAGLGNISSNPLFRDGPVDSVMSGYYLSNTAAGQSQSSPCIDRGVGPAVPFAEPNSYTTRTDSLPDTGIVDMGFHYPDSGLVDEYRLITYVVGGNGSIHPDIPAPGSFYREFTDISLTATPDAGYKVKQWTGADNVPAPKTNNNNLTIVEDTNVTVEFESLATYQLTTAVDAATPYGAIVPSSGPYQEDSVVTVTAVPAEGYIVDKWNGMPPVQYDPNHYTVVMDSDKTVTVRFISKYIMYDLTVEILDVNGLPAPGLGTIEPRRGGTYLIGTVVDVTAMPLDSNEYEIKQWTGTDNPASTDSHQTVTMISDKHVTVTIGKRIKYYLTVSVKSGYDYGTTVPFGGPFPYDDGEIVTITAVPDPGYELREWKIVDSNGPRIDSPENGDDYNVLTLIMYSDTNAEAAFQKGCSVNDSDTLRYTTIQEAIDKAGEGDYVRVGDGIWSGDGNRDLIVHDVNIDILSRNGAKNCIIDCGADPNHPHRGFDFNEITDPNLVFTITGFTIRNGFVEYGGGIHFYDVNASITLKNFVLEDNTADESGGGIYCFESEPVILNTEFFYNTSLDTGGGISCDSNSHADLINCLFAYNHSEYEGGAIYVSGSDPNIHLCTVAYNTSDEYGDAGYASGIYADSGDPNISNCIVGRNDYSAQIQGSVWGDESYNGDDLFGCQAVYSCIENGDGGEGNINDDPVFVTGSFGEFYLAEVYQYVRDIYGGYDVIDMSSCIDAGEGDFYINLQLPPPDGYELPNLTTSVFSTPDDDFTDIGYHYPLYTKGNFKYEITIGAGNNGMVQYYEILDNFGYEIGPLLGEVTSTSQATIEMVPYTRIRLIAVPDPDYIVEYWQRNSIYDYSYYNYLDFYAMGDEYFKVTFEPIHPRTIHVPGSFPYIGIQDAIESARNGDTIVIAPGTYPGNSFVVDKAIAITSIDPEDPSVVAATIIDCNLGDLGVGARAFTLVDDRGQGPALLNGFTIVNGRSSSRDASDGQAPGDSGGTSGSVAGGALRMYGDHTVKNCVLRNCWTSSGDGGNGAAGGISVAGVPIPDGGYGGDSGSASGGAIYIRGGSPLIQNCLIEDCYVSSGDGGNGGQGAGATAPPPADPSHPGGRGGDGGIAGLDQGARGGGIYCEEGSPTFENVIVRNCSATGGTGGDGGNGGANGGPGWGITTGGRGGDGGIPMPVFGGGVCCEPLTTPTFINCTIVDNLAQGGGGGNGGNAGGNIQNWWRGGIGGLTETADLLSIVEEYYESPPQYLYGPMSDEFYFGLDDYYAPYNFSTFGGGLFCGYASNSRFFNCDISNNVTIGAVSGFGGQSSSDTYYPPYKYMQMPSYGSGAYIGRNTTTVFSDCNVQGNRADYPGYPDTDPNYEHLGYGGGVCIKTGRFEAGTAYGIARFNNCQITGNTSPIGGGFYATGLTNFDITDSNFFDNLSYAGAGIFMVNNINAHIARCNFVNNRADNSVYPENPDPNIIEASIPGAGGGLFLFTTDVLVEDCWIINNNATGLGGGAYLGGLPSSLSAYDVKPRLNNCLITNNITNFNGGGVCCSWGAESTITNCTFTDNTATVSGGGIYCSYDSTTTLKNSIVWNNSSASGDEMALNDNNPYNPAKTFLNVSYSDVRNGQSGAFVGTDSVLNWGGGNIANNPMFVTGDLGNRYLSQVSAEQPANSPCVDAGSTLAKYLGLHAYTTSTENSPDKNMADMGYHYQTYVTIPGDFDHDGDVDLDDLSILLSYWLEQNCGLLADCEGADFEPDGDVDWYDYARFTEIFYLENIVDTTAPQPNPMTWEMEPSILDYHSVIMTATTATDESGVLYYFDCISGGCHDSDWQSSPTYTDTGLADDAAYTYRVRAADESPIKNTTDWSSEETVIIPSSSIDIFPPEPNPSTWQVEPFEDPNFFINMTATTSTDVSPPVMYYFDCTGPGNDSGWQLSPAYQDNVSTDESFYYYTVKAKDYYGFETIKSQQRRVWIDHRAPQPDPITWEQEPNAVSQVAIYMKATTATDPCGVEYYFACTSGGGHDSEWQASPLYTDTGLIEGLTYTYRVKTRDKSHNLNESAWSVERSATTSEDEEAPQPDPAEWAVGGEPNAVPGQYEITMTAKTATDVSDVQYYFECTAGGGNYSGWQDSSTYTDTGLDVNEIYTYRVKTRDTSLAQNETGWSTEGSALIDFTAPEPDPSEWAVGGEPYDYYDPVHHTYHHRMVAMTATDDNGFDPVAGVIDTSRVQYYFQCLHTADSGWRDSPEYTTPAVSGPGLMYLYKVKTRDRSTNHNETAYTTVWVMADPND